VALLAANWRTLSPATCRPALLTAKFRNGELGVHAAKTVAPAFSRELELLSLPPLTEAKSALPSARNRPAMLNLALSTAKSAPGRSMAAAHLTVDAALKRELALSPRLLRMEALLARTWKTASRATHNRALSTASCLSGASTLHALSNVVEDLRLALEPSSHRLLMEALLAES